nr:MAG TPA: hypothetical protein [Caudoviricetes sp.]
MIKTVYFIIQLILFLFMIHSFSNGVVYFIKNINIEEDFYLGVLLSLIIINLFIIIEQYKLLKNIVKNYKDEE